MKIATRTKATIAPNNKALLAKHASDKLSASPYYTILRFWAELLDQAADGVNCYFVAGTTRDKSSVTLKVMIGDDSDIAYANGLLELAEAVTAWLQTT